MIPREFEYHAPASVSDAIGLLERLGDEAKVLAGGHSLLPMMKMRFAQPAHLIDLGRIAELRGIREDKGTLAHRRDDHRERPHLVEAAAGKVPAAGRGRAPDLGPAGALQGHHRRRHRARRSGQRPSGADARAGRVVRAQGSAPASAPCPPTVSSAASTTLRSPPGEIITEIRIPIPAPGTGWCYAKLKRKTGDFATAAAAVLLRMKGDTVQEVAIALTNVAPTALRAKRVGGGARGQGAGRCLHERGRAPRDGHLRARRRPARRRGIQDGDGRRDDADGAAHRRTRAPRAEREGAHGEETGGVVQAQRQGRRRGGRAARAADPHAARESRAHRPAHRLRDLALRRLHGGRRTACR